MNCERARPNGRLGPGGPWDDGPGARDRGLENTRRAWYPSNPKEPPGPVPGAPLRSAPGYSPSPLRGEEAAWVQVASCGKATRGCVEQRGLLPPPSCDGCLLPPTSCDGGLLTPTSSDGGLLTPGVREGRGTVPRQRRWSAPFARAAGDRPFPQRDKLPSGSLPRWEGCPERRRGTDEGALGRPAGAPCARIVERTPKDHDAPPPDHRPPGDDPAQRLTHQAAGRRIRRRGTASHVVPPRLPRPVTQRGKQERATAPQYSERKKRELWYLSLMLCPDAVSLMLGTMDQGKSKLDSFVAARIIAVEVSPS